jgi:hypothetical protein
VNIGIEDKRLDLLRLLTSKFWWNKNFSTAYSKHCFSTFLYISKFHRLIDGKTFTKKSCTENQGYGS